MAVCTLSLGNTFWSSGSCSAGVGNWRGTRASDLGVTGAFEMADACRVAWKQPAGNWRCWWGHPRGAHFDDACQALLRPVHVLHRQLVQRDEHVSGRQDGLAAEASARGAEVRQGKAGEEGGGGLRIRRGQERERQGSVPGLALPTLLPACQHGAAVASGRNAGGRGAMQKAFQSGNVKKENKFEENFFKFQVPERIMECVESSM